ncbi:hypothetical protein LPJ70_002612 [Coemansia sp. RSA 2708]|nr:hypothetical protein LPJ70_002612 [Coemansia sp. RSA 2708]
MGTGDYEPAELQPSGPAVVTQERSVPVDPILATALRSSPDDRQFILEAERLVWQFLAHPRTKRLALPKQNSYRRLLLHKLAEYYALNHVVVGRQRDEIAFYKRTEPDTLELPVPLDARVPLVHADVEEPEPEPEPCTADSSVSFTHILVKRPQAGGASDDVCGEAAHMDTAPLRAAAKPGKSIEERQAEYERTRAAIFREDTAEPISR